MIEESIVITEEKYGRGIALDEYQGGYSLVSMHQGKDGNNYLDWIFPQDKDRKPRDKSLPWKIGLGNKQQAIQRLQMMIAVLVDMGGEDGSGSDIPF